MQQRERRYWLAKYGLKTRNPSKRSARPEAIAAQQAGRRTFRARCPKHGETVFLVRSDGGSRCRSCRSEMVVDRRRRVKEILVREAGGSCALCGYDRHLGGLAFHHVDAATKMMGIAYKGRALSIKTLRAEAEKCVLLCHNGHSEVEAGLLEVPIHLAPRTTEFTG